MTAPEIVLLVAAVVSLLGLAKLFWWLDRKEAREEAAREAEERAVGAWEGRPAPGPGRDRV